MLAQQDQTIDHDLGWILTSFICKHKYFIICGNRKKLIWIFVNDFGGQMFSFLRWFQNSKSFLSKIKA